MIDVIATELDDIYITGDTHFYHGNIIKYCHRPFLSAEDKAELDRLGGRWHDGSWKGPKQAKWKISDESVKIMNDTLIDNINKTVPKSGVLIHVGDWSIAPKEEEQIPGYVRRCTEMRERINCDRIFLCWGNHDNKHAIHHLFQWGDHRGKIVLNDLEIVCDHYFGGIWDASHRGAIQLYGHSHSEAEEGADRILVGRRNMDVGVDNAARLLGEYRPFRLKEILDIMASRPGFSFNPNTPTFAKGPREEAVQT